MMDVIFISGRSNELSVIPVDLAHINEFLRIIQLNPKEILPTHFEISSKSNE